MDVRDTKPAGGSPARDPAVPVGWGVFAGSLALFLATSSPHAVPEASAGRFLPYLPGEPFPPLSAPLWGFAVRAAVAASVRHLPLLLNALSAACGAAACWLLFRIVAGIRYDAAAEQDRRIIPVAAAAAAAAFLAVSTPFWLSANRAGPLTMDLALLLGAGFALVRYAAGGRLGWGLAAAAAASLAAAEYATALVFAPLAALALGALMRRAGHLRWRPLALAGLCSLAGPLLLALAAWAYARSPATAWREFTGYPQVLSYFVRELLAGVPAGFPRQGWLLVGLVTVLPGAAAAVGVRVLRAADPGVGSVLLNVVLVALGALLLLNAPLAPWSLTGASPLLAAPYVLAAAWFGAALGQLAAIVVHFGAVRLWTPRKAAALVSVAAAGIAGAGAVMNLERVDTSYARILHEVARDLVADLGPRTYVVADAVFEPYVKLEARVAGRPLVFLNPAPFEAPAYRKYAATLFADARLRSLALVGFSPLLTEWMRTTAGIEQELGIQGAPDLWSTGGFTAVPRRTIYEGSRDPRSLDADVLILSHKDYFASMKLRLRRLDAGPPAARKLGACLRATASRTANDLGILLEGLGRPDAALAAFRDAVDLAPAGLIARLNLLAFLEESGRREEAAELKPEVDRTLARRNPRETLDALVRVQGRLRAGAAGRLLGGDAQEQPADSDLVRAARLAAEDRLAEARQTLERIVGEKPEMDHAWVLLGMVAHRMGDAPAVQRCIARMREQGEHWPNLIAVMGRMALERGDRQSAREYFEQSLTFWPANAPVMEDLLRLLLEEGEKGRVEALVHDLLLVDPGSATGNFALGTLLLARGERDLAGDAFRRATERAPLPAALNNLAWIAMEDGDIEKAFALAQRAVAADARSGAAWHTLGAILARQGRAADAQAALKRAIALSPGNAEARVDLVFVQVSLGLSREAVAGARRLLADGAALDDAQKDRLRPIAERPD